MTHTAKIHGHHKHHTKLTEAMITECPAVDIHVHVPGTITPQTAWKLGIRNKLIEVVPDEDKRYRLENGARSIGETDPVKHYANIFCSPGPYEVTFDDKGNPINLQYNFACLGGQQTIFSGFDAVMGTVQGHRHHPGGIQNESDYRFVMGEYLKSCKEQNIHYTEALQNIKIAQVIYHEGTDAEKRAKFFQVCADIVKDFKEQGVTLRFQHCPNKTSDSQDTRGMRERSLEWVSWLKEAARVAPGVFVGLNTAGNEKKEKKEGGPEAMQEAYAAALDAGFGCEAHAGEGIGVEHMRKVMKTLPVTRIGHGVQVIESPEAVEEVRKKGITLIMMPCINISLHSTIHTLDGKPHGKLNPDGTRNPQVKTEHMDDLASHPFFELLRKDKLPIALASDDPEMGGESYKRQIKELAGLGKYKFPDTVKPLTAEELALCNLNAINAAFCDVEIKKGLVQGLETWMDKYDIHVNHPLIKLFGKGASPEVK